jgi:hypothetical protein
VTDAPYPQGTEPSEPVTGDTDVSDVLSGNNDDDAPTTTESHKVGEVVVLNDDDDTETVAIVTRVWTDENDGRTYVDAVAFPHGRAAENRTDVFPPEDAEDK